MLKKLLILAIVAVGLILRLYRLDVVPPSLYWDEASLGYNAYAVSRTLHDEHGEFLPVSRFIAFGDYKAPGYIYVDAVTIKLLGLSDFTVRFPSAVAGTLLVLLAYFLAKELFKNDKAALISSLLVAVSPWSLQMSRGAFEANLATLFSGLGTYFFIRLLHKYKFIHLILSALFFAAAMYTFNSHRIFVPLMIAGLSLIYLKEIKSCWKNFLSFPIIFLIVLLPLIPHVLSAEGRLRFQEVSWLNDLNPITTSNNRVALDDNAWWSKLLHNRRLVYAQQFLIHYTDNFKAGFLFFSGDVNPRLSIQTVGEMYWWELPLLILGAYILASRKDKTTAILALWILIAPIPAAMARETPHALRILQILPIPQLLVSLGVVSIIRRINILKFLLPPLITIFFFAYLHDYYLHYRQDHASDWQYGYKQMVQEVAKRQDNYDFVSTSDLLGRPYIYFLLYNKYDPQKYWVTRKVERDAFGFWYVHSFDKYFVDANQKPSGRGLYVRLPTEVSPKAHILSTIEDTAGKPVFVVYD